MRLGIAFVILACLGVASAQQPGSQRAEYIHFLAEQPVDLKLLPALLSALDDKDPQVRLEALRTWGKVADAYVSESYEDGRASDGANVSDSTLKAVQDLQHTILNKIRPTAKDGEPVRLEALRTLCLLGESVKSICPPMMGCGTGIENEFWYQAVQELRAQVQSNRSLIEKLTSDGNPDVVMNALIALGEEFQKTQKAKGQSLLSHPNKYFRALGIWLISDRDVWDHVSESTLRLLTPLLDDSDEDIVKTAENHLTFSEAQAMEYSLPAPQRSIKLRLIAIDHVGFKPSEKVDNLLRRLLDDSNAEIRASALQALFESEHPKDLGRVKSMLSDPSPEVQAVALGIAASEKLPGLLPFLKNALVSTNRHLRQSALWSTGRVPGSDSLSLEQIRCVELGVEDSYMANPAFGDARFPDLIGQCLNSKSSDVRQLLSFYYSEEGTPKPVDIMIRLAKDPDVDVARIIIPDLGPLKDHRAFDTLVELTASTNKTIKRYAFFGLSCSKRASAIDVLQKFANDTDRSIRREAKTAIDRLQKELGIQ